MTLYVYETIGSDDIQPRVLKELDEMVAKLLYIILEKSQLSGTVSGDHIFTLAITVLQWASFSPSNTQVGAAHRLAV